MRILIAEKFQLIRTALSDLLNSQRDIYVVGETDNGIQLIKKYFELKPDIVISEIFLPSLSGIDAFTELKQKNPCVKFLFLSSYNEEKYYLQCMNIGACGFLHKDISVGELIHALKEIFNGNILTNYSQTYIFNKNNLAINNLPVYFTDREREILSYIGKGFKSKEIGVQLNLSKRTIDYYRANIIKKLGATSIADLVQYAVRNYL